jgi:hypothetical protein
MNFMSRNPPQPPNPLVPWRTVRAYLPFVCELKGPEALAALRELQAPTMRNHAVVFVDARGGGIPLPTWIDWTDFPER